MAKLKPGQQDYTKKNNAPKSSKRKGKNNKINFTKERAESIVSRIDADIAANYPVFYTGGQIYLHRNVRNFNRASVEINAELRRQIGTLVSAFKKDAAVLIQICEKNEHEFFSKLNAHMRTLDPEFQPYTRTSFQSMFQQNFQTTINVQLSNLTGELAKIPKGKKTIAQLKNLANWFMLLEQTVKDLQLNDYLDADFLSALEARNKHILTHFSNKLPVSVNEASTTIPGSAKKVKEMVAGLSTGSANLYLLPSILEALVAQNFDALQTLVVDKRLESITKRVASDTAKGTSGDIEVLSAQFSVKMNQKDLKQTKKRKLQTFFDWNTDLQEPIQITPNNGNVYLNSLQTAMGDTNTIAMIQYLLMNYANMSNSDIKVLTDAFQILALSGLNEKIFGYNKKRQDQIFANIIDKLPIAVINGQGEIIYMKDLMLKIVSQIETNFANIKTMAKVTVNKTRVNVQALNRKKKEALNQIPGDFKYTMLKQMVATELQTVTNQLLSAIQVSVAYKIHYDDILNEIMK